jgi:hypothetical protein
VPAAITWTNAGIPLAAALIGAIGGVVGGLWGARSMARSERDRARAARLRVLYGPIIGFSLALRSYLGAISGEMPPDAPPEAFARNAMDVERRRAQCIDAMSQMPLEGISLQLGVCLNRLLESADECNAASVAPGSEGFAGALAKFDAVTNEIHELMTSDLIALDPLPRPPRRIWRRLAAR